MTTSRAQTLVQAFQTHNQQPMEKEAFSPGIFTALAALVGGGYLGARGVYGAAKASPQDNQYWANLSNKPVFAKTPEEQQKERRAKATTELEDTFKDRRLALEERFSDEKAKQAQRIKDYLSRYRRTGYGYVSPTGALMGQSAYDKLVGRMQQQARASRQSWLEQQMDQLRAERVKEMREMAAKYKADQAKKQQDARAAELAAARQAGVDSVNSQAPATPAQPAKPKTLVDKLTPEHQQGFRQFARDVREQYKKRSGLNRWLGSWVKHNGRMLPTESPVQSIFERLMGVPATTADSLTDEQLFGLYTSQLPQAQR